MLLKHVVGLSVHVGLESGCCFLRWPGVLGEQVKVLDEEAAQKLAQERSEGDGREAASSPRAKADSSSSSAEALPAAGPSPAAAAGSSTGADAAGASTSTGNRGGPASGARPVPKTTSIGGGSTTSRIASFSTSSIGGVQRFACRPLQLAFPNHPLLCPPLPGIPAALLSTLLVCLRAVLL